MQAEFIGGQITPLTRTPVKHYTIEYGNFDKAIARVTPIEQSREQ